MQRVKKSNHYPKLGTIRHLTMDYFEPHKKLIRQMMKEERKHQKISDKNPKATLKLRRIEKKFTSLSQKLKAFLLRSNQGDNLIWSDPKK